MEYVEHSDDDGRKNLPSNLEEMHFLCILCIITTSAEKIPIILEVSTSTDVTDDTDIRRTYTGPLFRFR